MEQEQEEQQQEQQEQVQQQEQEQVDPTKWASSPGVGSTSPASPASPRSATCSGDSPPQPLATPAPHPRSATAVRTHGWGQSIRFESRDEQKEGEQTIRITHPRRCR